MPINKPAPQFTKKDFFGDSVSLKNYEKSHDYVLLVFLRYSGCPWCNLAIHRLTLEYETMQEHSCQIIAFVQSEDDSIQENIYDRHTPKPQFPIIADKDMEIYRQYDVNPSLIGTLKLIKDVPHWLHAVNKLGFKNKGIDGNLFLVPAWFLINTRNGYIVRGERGASFYDHETFVSIYDALTFRD
jgi:peroxiredoxin